MILNEIEMQFSTPIKKPKRINKYFSILKQII
jgi:hypothetical protein